MSPASGPIRIASRGSELALWQARAVERALRDADPGTPVEIQVVRTTGDRILDVPLAKIGDKGLFTKELDEALLRGDADLAVHSLKDVPTRLPDGLEIVAVTAREDPRDVLIRRDRVPGALADLPDGTRVGTSSLRRRAQLRALRPDLEVVDLRGNLNTRLAKLDAGEYDAIVLAAAGVLRLGWADRISGYLDAGGWLPAVGQGALAVVARADAAEVRERLRPLHDPATADATAAERAFLQALEGGCQI
ncbi:MAG TPA: hydroxymethylbilane synthase, partial [Longimicrobiaceae bacterium]|nr:hydroxymethylbilane synthase [Longimicrobiaceae bacterium]